MKTKLSHLTLALLCLLPAVGFTACQRQAQEEKPAEEAAPGTPQQERPQEEDR